MRSNARIPPRSVAARRNIKLSTLQGRRRKVGESEQVAE